MNKLPPKQLVSTYLVGIFLTITAMVSVTIAYLMDWLECFPPASFEFWHSFNQKFATVAMLCLWLPYLTIKFAYPNFFKSKT